MLDKDNNFLKTKYLIERLRANLYFDFETTFDDIVPRYQNEGHKRDEKNDVREQIDFAASIVTDVKFNLSPILKSLAFDQGKNVRFDEHDLDFTHR